MLTVTTVQLMRGYLLHYSNIMLCIHLYISQISGRAELNIHTSGFLSSEKSVFSFLKAKCSVLREILNVPVSFLTLGQQYGIFESKTWGRMPQEKPCKSHVKNYSNQLKGVSQNNFLSFRLCPDSKTWVNIT